MKMDAYGPEGNKLLPTVMLRGHFVSVLTLLTSKETGEDYLLLVKQRRVGNGAIFFEHPAGMMDEEVDPYVVALRELEEETGLVIRREDLHLLNEDLFYTSPGLLDEGGYFFWTSLEMFEAEIFAFNDKHHGDESENEFITTEVVKIEDAFDLIRNASGLLNLYMFLDAQGGLDAVPSMGLN